jgi:capsular polysaccharide biosynthesis protein
MEFQQFGPEQAASGLPKSNTTAAFWRGFGVALSAAVVVMLIRAYLKTKIKNQDAENSTANASLTTIV